MSVLIVPNLSKILLQRLVVGVSALVPARMHLWQNNFIPIAGTTSANLANANFTGYAFGALANPVVAGALDAANRAVCSWDAITWTKNGLIGNTIYGYWVSDAANGMLWVERFDQPIPMLSDGSYLVITPAFTGMSQFSNA
jgi:hypothetical protein